MKALVGLGVAVLLAGCQASAPPSNSTAQPTSQPTATQPTPSAPSTTSASPSQLGPSPSLEPCQEAPAAGTGPHTTGTVKGKIAAGRILFNVEGGFGTAGGTFAFVDIDSTGLHQMDYPLDASDGEASWASATDVLFASQRAGEKHIFRLDTTTGTVKQVTSEPGTAEAGPVQLADRRLVFSAYSCSDAYVDAGLYVSAADGTGITELTPGPRPGGFDAFDGGARVSPDGSTIVFVRARDDTTGAIFTVPTAGGAVNRLTPDGPGVASPQWSPDGKTILFTQETAESGTLFTVPAAGGTPKQLFARPAGEYALEGDWSPDGTQVMFKDYRQGWTYNELHLVNVDGANEQTLWQGDFSTAEHPDWGP